MTRPAGRGHDKDSCPKHVVGEQLPDDKSVNVNGRSLVYATSMVQCPGCHDFIVTGSGTVNLGKQPVVRALDRTMHGGTIQTGSGNVNVGGPSVGVALGYSAAAKAACEALATGRRSGAEKQTYGNCGIESARLIINKARGESHTENEVFGHAIDKGYTDSRVSDYDGKNNYTERVVTRRTASGHVVVDHIDQNGPTDDSDPVDDHRGDVGSLKPNGQRDVMNDYGVPAETMDQTMDNVIQAAADGKGVITLNHADTLWDESKYKGSTHAVNVTGVAYDANGNVTDIITADTGWGDCCRSVPRDRFEKSFVSPFGITVKIAVTKSRVWP